VSDEKWTSPKNWYIDHEYLRVDGARLPLSEVRALVGSLLILEATTTEHSRPDLSKLHALADQMHRAGPPHRSFARVLRELLAEIEGKP
jgi:hypothetical protein